MDRPAVPEPAIETIREAGLRYGTDRQAGIRRRPAGRGFAYSSTDERRLASATRERSLSEIEQRLQVLGEQIHILNNQLTAQMAANERQLQTLNSEVQALGHKYESRLKELEDALHVRR